MLGARIAQRRQIEPRKEMLAAAQQDRRDRDVHFVDEARLEILAHRGRPAADLDIAPPPAHGLPGATERFLDSACDAMNDAPSVAPKPCTLSGLQLDRAQQRRRAGSARVGTL